MSLIILILAEMLILFLGCQGGGDSPVFPTFDPASSDTMMSDSLVESGQWMRDEESKSPFLWGYYTVMYDSSTGEIITTPLRRAEFVFNIVKFLQPPLGVKSGVGIGVLHDSEFGSTGRIDIRVILHHPFPDDPVYTGFDVCGLFITNGSLVSPANPLLRYSDPEVDPTLLNPDGYTRWMNPTEFTTGGIFGYEPGMWGSSEQSENSGFVAGATLNAYKYFAHGLSPDATISEWLEDPQSVENRGMFPSGASCGRDYELLFPIVGEQHSFVFNYAVMANWASPEIKPPEDPLVDFPPEANAGWPLHILVTDNSEAYYTEEEAGGTLSFDIELFDWDALSSPYGLPGEVSKFVVWSHEPLVPGGAVEFLSTEIEWNSGFTASTSVATIEIAEATPEASGDTAIWIEIQSANPTSYDQGFGAGVPDDPLASYFAVLVDVETCPKAGANEIEGGVFDSGDFLDDVHIYGENFVEGDQLGVWLELGPTGGGEGESVPFIISGMDVHRLDDGTLTADFDLTDAPYGDYGLGCSNGCGIVTTPIENEIFHQFEKMQVNVEAPIGVSLATNRQGGMPDVLSAITVTWQPVSYANFYRIYARFYDINGNQVGGVSMIGSAAFPSKTIYLSFLPTGSSGIIEFWVTALPDPYNWKYESGASNHAFAFLQDFEIGMGQWTTAEETTDFRFIRSTVEASFSGAWGIKQYGAADPYQGNWLLVSSPEIPDTKGASKVVIEFLHTFADINESNGFQIGWMYALPLLGQPLVLGYYPIAINSYGQGYNDTHCPALMEKFLCGSTTDNNFQSNEAEWSGWALSGFDVSEILGDGEGNRIVIGLATDSWDEPKVCIDDIAILLY